MFGLAVDGSRRESRHHRSQLQGAAELGQPSQHCRQPTSSASVHLVSQAITALWPLCEKTATLLANTVFKDLFPRSPFIVP